MSKKFVASDYTIHKAVSRYLNKNPDKLPPISEWNTSQVTDMNNLFRRKNTFNEDISNWDVSNVTNMDNMFNGASSFNQPLNNWNVSNVINMNSMFSDALSFNQILNNWDISKVDNMSNMFYGATNFNQPLDNWSFSENPTYYVKKLGKSVTIKNMIMMFKKASSFNQDLRSWVNKLAALENIDFVSMDNMFESTSMSPEFIITKEMVEERWEELHPNTNQQEEILDSRGSYELYPNKQDPGYIMFNDAMLKAINGKNNVIIRSPGYNFIPDALINNEQIDPYRVYYEIFDGKSYPIIHILKGTLLFTGRKNKSDNQYVSFNYLYKLHNNESINSYKNQGYENVLTYFFPIPMMCHAVSSNFKQMDVVVLTQDIKLLCLISPSPMIRGDRHDMSELKIANSSKKYNNENIKKCLSRDYDICMSQKIIDTLMLNGYIGIAQEDSLSKHYDTFKQILKEEFETSALYTSSTFNNKVNLNKLADHQNSFIEEAVNRQKRVFGIPEIVLIPYNIHKYSDNSEYLNIKNQFAQNQTSSEKLPENIWEKFVFKPFISVNAQNTLDLAKLITDALKNLPSTRIRKSLQAYPLLNVDYNNMEPGIRDGYTMEYSSTSKPTQIMFMDTYSSTRNSEDLTALELMNMYTLMNDVIKSSLTSTAPLSVGGKMETQNMPNQLLSQTQDLMNPKELIINKGIHQNKLVISTSKNPVYERDNFYYTEVNGIPVVYFERTDNRNLGMNNGGTQKKISSKQKTTYKRKRRYITRKKNKPLRRRLSRKK